MKQHIVVAGNIGAGKSTLVRLLSDRMGWKPYYEPVSENPYLEDFYDDMSRWAFKSQLYFLSDRLGMHKQLQDYRGSVVQDRSVYEDAHIFARNLHLQGFIEKRDFQTYWRLYEVLVDLLERPDIIIYLKASLGTLKQRIARRGRDFEATIPDEYLNGLNELYEEWIGGWKLSPVLTLDMDNINFQDSDTDFDFAAGMIQDTLRGNQGELFS
jgi:deoxyadenosine/deoxycytidine kinase